MRPAVAGVALGIALAVGIPVGWAVTRPPAAVGTPVEQVLDGGAPPSPSAPPSVPPPSVPPPSGITTRDATPAAATVVPGPARLAVPDLGVDAAVAPVGVEPDGQMTIPAEVDRVGWYRFGPAPGAPGSAVLAGHVDSRDQGLGAMAPLREAEVGQEVLVTDATGAVTRWRVVGRELIEKPAVPLEALFARSGAPRLVLITCGGPYLPELGSYRDNVVVVAEPLA